MERRGRELKDRREKGSRCTRKEARRTRFTRGALGKPRRTGEKKLREGKVPETIVCGLNLKEGKGQAHTNLSSAEEKENG